MAKSVFLTGATGTIGSALVPELLRQPQTRITLLVRARDDADLAARMAEMGRYWGATPDGTDTGRVQALRGDIAQPRFGLDDVQYERLVQDTTHIVHCAASVKLNMSLEEARATAVTPTRSMLELARRARDAGPLRKVDLVSTVGVWGRTPGVMPERRLPEVDSFHNTYEAAKSEAEKVVWDEGDGLPITVHRPSMVVGETGSGRVIHFQVFYHLCEFLSGVRTFGVMPTLGTVRLDTIPVDWVAQAIAWSSDRPEMAGRILHLCSGAERSIPLTRLQQVVRQTWRAAGRPVPRLWGVSRRLLESAVPVIGLLAGESTRRALRGLPPVLAYLAEDQGFGNAETARLLADAGLPVPKVEDYLPQVLDHYLQRRRTPAAR
ncbi:SDR family oxidoreductase [Aquincola sp. S2]|uniref:SDR family oxidoreductase n=1 Tax=Pseudaquabacterium terrae TaxID=2732868 RepID=A0ABX2ECV0_9BURK|nr:SDR family oxidoreductase [Aquabacterium terrae]NRF66483.1 SDR family oxidoreductase [Aquabacterium terrae]